MSHQIALTIITAIKTSEMEDLKQLLTSMGDTIANNVIIPFGKLSKTHFARFMVLDESVDLDGSRIAPSLVFMIDCDAPLDRNLKELVDVAGAGLDKIYCHCEGYPCHSEVTRGKRLAYLRSNMEKTNLFYVNTIGRTVQQIRQEAQLRKAIQEFLDHSQQDWEKQDPVKVRAAIQSFVFNEPGLHWARKSATPPSFFFRLKEMLHMVGVPLGLLIFFPLVFPAFLLWLVLLRIHELTDPVPSIELDPTRIQALEGDEDFIVQNQFGTVGYIKPGWFWRFTTIATFWLANYATRHIFNKGNLAGLRTVHFGHLIRINNNRRVIFTSYYDGSLESYMDDFIDKVAWVLNTAFGNIVGYPRTRWLILDGAREEQGFKNYNRGHQVRTQVWYSAYDNLTAANLENNAKIRAGLFRDMSLFETEEWFRLL
ncbi:hypothetical protein KDH_01580 [Dictyobacter sp. S3.2.2.5]|uniref:Uncharacterized protein n=1 Tax=Dictyobacter halimunensis TaxID=3026934 RepID=A0ABQ6FH40_9CHLR|nr:hypothetical protein KDH_01580 [Dictyobacter sp. S3.2.2.5]